MGYRACGRWPGAGLMAEGPAVAFASSVLHLGSGKTFGIKPKGVPNRRECRDDDVASVITPRAGRPSAAALDVRRVPPLRRPGPVRGPAGDAHRWRYPGARADEP